MIARGRPGTVRLCPTWWCAVLPMPTRRLSDRLAASLGKTLDGRYRSFFRWKQLENPFGRRFMLTARARTAAESWSTPVDIGDLPGAFAHLAAPARAGLSLVTDRSPELVRWSYAGFPAVSSRALPAGQGAVIARFRRRGDATECAIADVRGEVDPRSAARAVRDATRRVGSDYDVAGRSTPVDRMAPARRLGPLQTRSDLQDSTSQSSLVLALGDVELF